MRSCLSLAVAVAVLVAAAPARAVTLDYAAGTLSIAGTGGDDSVLLSGGVGTVEVKSWSGSTLTPGAAAVCAAASFEDDHWSCPRPQRIVIDFGAGDDDLSVYQVSDAPFTVPIQADGGPGDDVLWGASGADVLSGGAGDDRLYGAGGDDRLSGDDGNDRLAGSAGDDVLDGGAGDDSLEDEFAGPLGASGLGAGADTYVGGPGYDRFSYAWRAASVTITLDGVADDGEAGERDNVHPDIEEVGGGLGDDVLIGSPGPDHLWGNDGNDRIHGGAGDDRLDGNGGDDVLDGGPGDDVLDGGCMSDTLIGGPGRDTFNSDGTCGFALRSPFDRIEARDGEADALIFCQRLGDPVGDLAIVDAIDPVTMSGAGACGTVDLPPAGSPGPLPPAGRTAALRGTVRVRLGALRLLTGTGAKGAAAAPRIELKRKRLTLGTLVAGARTTVTVTVKARKVALGRRKLTLAAGRTVTLTVPLSTRGRSALGKRSRADVAVALTVGKTTRRATFRAAIRRA